MEKIVTLEKAGSKAVVRLVVQEIGEQILRHLWRAWVRFSKRLETEITFGMEYLIHI
jgi:hypothetical protein